MLVSFFLSSLPLGKTRCHFVVRPAFKVLKHLRCYLACRPASWTATVRYECISENLEKIELNDRFLLVQRNFKIHSQYFHNIHLPWNFSLPVYDLLYQNKLLIWFSLNFWSTLVEDMGHSRRTVYCQAVVVAWLSAFLCQCLIFQFTLDTVQRLSGHLCMQQVMLQDRNPEHREPEYF